MIKIYAGCGSLHFQFVYIRFQVCIVLRQLLRFNTMTTSTPVPAVIIGVDDEDEDIHSNHPESPTSPVLQDLQQFLSRTTPSSLFDKSATAVPVAAIKALLGVVQRSKAETMMGLQDELREASELMTNNYHRMTQRSSSKIALQSGIELFLKYITRTFLETPNFDECREAVLERGERFQTMSLAARDRIANVACEFILPNTTILTHGWSRVVAAILLEASKTKHFDVIILEGRPDASGAKAAQFYAQETNIPITVIPDAAMAYILEKVDMVLVGAEGVVENGGIVNKIGTYALAACAATAGKPCYVAAESYKFARLYPLHQSDLPSQPEEYLHFVDTSGVTEKAVDPILRPVESDESIQRLNPFVDFTPAKFITLLFTDLGVLTPSAVSDELIRLYQ